MYKMVSQYRPTRISQWKNLRRVRGVQKRQKPYLIEASNSQIFEVNLFNLFPYSFFPILDHFAHLNKKIDNGRETTQEPN